MTKFTEFENNVMISLVRLNIHIDKYYKSFYRELNENVNYTCEDVKNILISGFVDKASLIADYKFEDFYKVFFKDRFRVDGKSLKTIFNTDIKKNSAKLTISFESVFNTFFKVTIIRLYNILDELETRILPYSRDMNGVQNFD